MRRAVLVAAAALGGLAAPVRGQETLSFRDTLVLKQIAFQAPCPSPPPAAWLLRDPSLGAGWRCSLVEYAARAVSEFLGIQAGRPGAVNRTGDPWTPLCVRLIEGRNTGTTGLPGDWLVVFDLAADRPAHVVIDRQTGGVGSVMLGRGVGSEGPGSRLPRCLD